ncbi:MAG: 3-hydroxyacyl-ACP dehydratase FabZ [Desulfobacterales bacterium]|jgi:beta-hydroxyacyl-ACP dehydratase FabZ|nr:3-hydroxyacyl-ACP dehydratase FabZ [Desulfobacterales bacterium]MDD3081701.1 3-hydroxyacyl-ACP dehydratase FabZ [Desulfobacterales bacterium]MDD3949793.1 3-hydroxyacyl-ACP dehydratase FabZ [Desulfobacterales bacterium]MDD4462939.1 3-hydroxyacyl-ACP dehydratase FabZ [Desulfobacterales bacterium]MDY0378471.1 3-hydroxyacyl-ACP dehydratase FabZ [Desulfobacterales bacterium]
MKQYSIAEIMNFLPHRYPFLLIDRVVELVSGERITALKNVTINEPFFQGHFPGTPIMPGVLILEAMAQAGGILALDSMPEALRGAVIYFMGMDKVRFRKPVVPGDQLIFEIRALKQRAKAVKMAGIARVEDNIVAEAEMMASFGEKK